MGNTDSVPVVSQAKSLVQYVSGDSAGALATQKNFAYNNTFPVVSQIASAGYAIGGDMDKAEDLQKKFAKDLGRVIDSIPGAGHIKGGVHYAMGDNKQGDESMKAASRSTGVVIGGVGGFAAGGPVGAVAGGLAGGAAMDGIITGSDKLINKENATSYGYIAAGERIADAVKGKKKIDVSEGFDMAMMPVGDGLAGYASGNMIGKAMGVGPASAGKSVPALPIGKGVVASEFEGGASGGGVMNAKPALEVVASAADENMNVPLPRQNNLGLDKAALNNRANQLNPNHIKTGPGRPAGYQGDVSKAGLDNHANQLNPNNVAYHQSRLEQGSAVKAVDGPTRTGAVAAGVAGAVVHRSMSSTASLDTDKTHTTTSEASSDYGLSIGTVFSIIFFVGGFLYFAGGMLFRKYLLGATGKEMVPHYDFWSKLPLRIRDGILFTINGCKNQAIPRPYERV